MLVQIREEHTTILDVLQKSADEAIRHYAIEKVQRRLLQAEQNVQRWEQKYGCSYDLFAYQTSSNEDYIDQLERETDKQDWEGDLFEWEFDVEVLAGWQGHLQNEQGSHPGH